MKTRTLLFAAMVPLAAFFLFSSFTGEANHITSGGGEAGGKKFHYTAIMNASGVSGHFSWDGKTYEILCVYRPNPANGTASLYLSDGLAVNVVDGRKMDQVSVPFLYTAEDCHAPALSLSEIVMRPVSKGSLMVRK